MSYSRLLKVLQQSNLPDSEALANQILNNYYSDESPGVTNLYSSIEILNREVAIGRSVSFYRNISGKFSIMAEVGELSAASLTDKHELADCIIRLAKKVVEGGG